MPLTLERIKAFCWKNIIPLCTVIGVLCGIILGLTLLSLQKDKLYSRREVMYVQFIGDIYLRILRALVLPLTLSAVISSIGNLNVQMSWKIAAISVGLFFGTTLVAVIEGFVLVQIIRPGVGSSAERHISLQTENTTVVDNILDIFRNMFPPNLVQATFKQFRTILLPPENKSIPIEDWEISHQYYEGINILGLVVFSFLLGTTLRISGNSGKSVLNFFEVLYASSMMMINWVLWISPVAVFSLVAARFLGQKNIFQVMESLSLYFITVLIGLFVHAIITLPSLYFFITKKTPFKFLANMSPALIVAFGTASSNVALPISMECLEEKNKIDKRVVEFTMPISTMMNLDGTALYEIVAIIFITQVREVPLNFGQMIAACIVVAVACLAGSGIPQAGLMIMTIALTTVGLPAEEIELIIAVDWLVDRFRTTVNVIGDSYLAGIVNHFSKDELLEGIVYEGSYARVPDDERFELTAKE